MAQTITKISQTTVINRLDTYNHTAASTSIYGVDVKLSEVPASGISIVVQLNGSTKATSTAPSATQNHIELHTTLNCTATDVISVIISSANAIDKQLNTVQGIIAITRGTP